jgi:hypothetical protein
MANMSTLAELHVRQFVSRQKRQDEINEDTLRLATARRRKRQTATWQEAAVAGAGPLGLLDAVGQAEEAWMEMLERAPRCDMSERPQPATTTRRQVPQLRPRTA